MPSRRARSASWAALGLLAGALLGCSIERVSQGSQLRADPNESITNGKTTKSDVLRVFGPPDQIQRQLDGDVFTYSYMRRYSRELALQAPQIDVGVSYKSSDEKRDRLVVLFDKGGVVSGFGFRQGTKEMPGKFSLLGNDRAPEPVARAAQPTQPAAPAAASTPVVPEPSAVSATARAADKSVKIEPEKTAER